MRFKIAPHYEQSRPVTTLEREWMSASGWVLVMDPPGGDSLFPDQQVVGRPWIGGDDIERAYVLRGKSGAQAYLDRCRSFYERSQYDVVWIGPNELDYKEAEIRHAAAEFWPEWADLMARRSYKTGVVCSSQGQPDVTNEQQIEELRPALECGDYLVLHEYGWPRLEQSVPWHTLRYRLLADLCERMGIVLPPILIGELGLDRNVSGEESAGWRKAPGISTTLYAQDLAWYAEEIGADDRVEAAFLFGCNPSNRWNSHQVTRSLIIELLAAWSTRHPDDAVPVPEEPTDPEAEDVSWALWDAMRSRRLSRFAGAALTKKARGLGFVQESNEQIVTVDADEYVAQIWYDENTDQRWLVWCVRGHYTPDDIRIARESE